MSNSTNIIRNKDQYTANLAIRTQHAFKLAVEDTLRTLRRFKAEVTDSPDDTVYEAGMAVFDHYSKDKKTVPDWDSTKLLNSGHAKEFLWALYLYRNTPSSGAEIFSDEILKAITSAAHINYDSALYSSLPEFCKAGALHGFTAEQMLADEALIVAANPDIPSEAIAKAFQVFIAPKQEDLSVVRPLNEDSLLTVATYLASKAFTSRGDTVSVASKKFAHEESITTSSFIAATGILSIKLNQFEATLENLLTGAQKIGYQSDISKFISHIFWPAFSRRLNTALVQAHNVEAVASTELKSVSAAPKSAKGRRTL